MQQVEKWFTDCGLLRKYCFCEPFEVEDKEKIMSSTTHYKDLGLVNTREMFKKAMEGQFAVPAYNFNNMEQLQGIILGCVQSRSPVILQVSGSARKYANQTFLKYMAMGAVQMAKASGADIPIALHLDHGDSFELARSCIDSGFSSVMLDGSHHPFEENARITRQVVDYAHARDVTVEGELGVLAGVEDEVSHETSHFTKPEEVEEFLEKTGVDSLAISIGTSHGAYKFKIKPGEEVPPLRFDILEEIATRTPGFPHCITRRLDGGPRICRDHQQVWWQNGQCGGQPRRSAQKGSRFGRLQNQYRQRRSPGDDSGYSQNIRPKSIRV